MIVAVEAESAAGSEADVLDVMVGRARFAGHRVDELGADSGYASADSYQQMQRLGVTAYIPPLPNASTRRPETLARGCAPLSAST